MDILIHTLSGTATAGVIALQTSITLKQKLKWMLLGGFVAALPDIDAISLWSGFDSTLGEWLGLSHSGYEIYFGKFWYSHHGFFHSLLAAALLAILFVLIRKSWHPAVSFKHYASSASTKVLFALFFCAYLSHLLGDLPTPAAGWGGIRLFFPFKIYVGGWGFIWWWNNYDVFLSLLATNILLIILVFIHRAKNVFKVMALVCYAAGVFLTCYSIGNRAESFAYSGSTLRYNYYEKVSRRDQYRILGRDTYVFMRTFDRKLPVLF